MICLTDPEILAFVEGDLPSETRHRVEMHLNACSLCCSVVAGMGQSSPETCPLEESIPGPLLANGEPRYVAGPEIARGGMGRILAGEDRLLRRPVALKLLRRTSASLVRRFQREQRVTARLQHPAIVPVYDAGVLEDGEPFFVMRLVKGQSLDRIAARAASLRERLQMLPAVLGVVDAVAYAHGEGVVHRDLKPQNVLVGPFGEVVVLDWGLARELNTGTEHAVEAHEVNRGDASEHGMTLDGERLGTVAYMAPEQAAGQEADARSDVYGLGAILYQVLSGRPPHAERSTSLSTKAVRHRPPGLARLAPEVPSDLVAIVARAMASGPGARYASAQELAADLKRWQAGLLVEAHRYSLRELLRRFRQRYRAPLLVGAVALVVLLGFGGVAVWRIVAERGDALAAQAVAEEERAVAEEARAIAEEAWAIAERQRVAAEKLVQFILNDLRPRVEPLGRLDVLADAARAVMGYEDNSPYAADAAAWLRRAQAAGLAGDVALDIGDLDAAEESFQRSRTASAPTAAGDTEAATIAHCHAENELGHVNRQRGDLATADSHFEACGALTRDATDPKRRAQYLLSRQGLADTAMRRGDLAAAQTILEEGLADAAALDGADDPGSESSRLVLQFRYQLWYVLGARQELAESRDMAVAYVALARARVEARPGDATARFSLAAGLSILGVGEMNLGNLAAAARHCQEQLDLIRLLVAQDPSNMKWQFSLAYAYGLQGDVLMARGDAGAALPLKQSSIDLLDRISASSPEDVPLQETIAISRQEKGSMLMVLGRPGEARQEFERASDIFESLVERNGGLRGALGITLGELGRLELSAHRIAVGQAHLQRSIDLFRQVLATEPTFRHDLAEALATLADSERGPAARGYIEEAVELLKPLRGQVTGDPELSEIADHVDRIQRKVRARR